MVLVINILILIFMILMIMIFFGANRQPKHQIQGFTTLKFHYEAKEDVILIEKIENNNIILHYYIPNKRPGESATSDELYIGYCNIYCLGDEAIYWECLEGKDQWDSL